MARTLKWLFIPVLIDLVILALSFGFTVWVKPGPGINYLTKYTDVLIIMAIAWILISLILDKYSLSDATELKKILLPVVLSNLAALALVVLFIYLFREAYFSRFVLLGTVLTATAMEIVLGNIYYYIHRSVEIRIPGNGEYRGMGLSHHSEILETLYKQEVDLGEPEVEEYIRNVIIEECGMEGFLFLKKKARLNDRKTLILSTTSRFNVETKAKAFYHTLINIRRVNDIRRVNKFLESVNSKLSPGGSFIGCLETKDLRKQRILKKFFPPFNYLFYYFIDFPLKRVFPKFTITKGIYFFLTKGNNRVITRAEILGRLVSCGFEIEDEGYVGRLFYFMARKVKDPAFDMNPSYGPFVRLRRIGKDGRIIRVLKMRTMHPYAEYLQEYVYKKHNLQNGGKFNNDFRVSTQGRIMRKLWIDELPMLYNWLKGEMKLFGVRPLSEQYFSLYNLDLQQKRLKFKPGLIPPFYVDLPETLDEIQESEMRYLDAYEIHPFRTDWKYFWKAMYNIAFRNARSK